DGIRDRNVTGVQTCALPISTLLLVPFASKLAKTFGKKEVGATGMALAMLAALLLFAVRTDSPYVFMAGYALIQTGVACVNVLIRSEERRVGKECRYRCASNQ